MRLETPTLEHHPRRPPPVDEVSFHSLYEKSTYVVDTSDRWSLVVSRYKPVRQSFDQPLFMEPMLLVHGFSQNRHAWTSGEFVKNLLFFGVDVHILELRGHGKSSVELQHQRSRKFGRPLPADLDYGWDLDSYFLYDLPAAVAAVRRVTQRPRIFYCGHSMGGMLGYGYAGIHDHFDGLITIGSASDLGRGFPLLKLAAHSIPFLSLLLDVAYGSYNFQRKANRAGSKAVAQLLGKVQRGAREVAAVADQTGKALSRQGADLDARLTYVPVDQWLRLLERGIAKSEESALLTKLTARLNRLSNMDRVSMEDIRWLLREGGEREPRRVVEQFAKWIRRSELVCYRTGYDFKRGFSKIRIPMAIIFGDMDPLASVESTRGIYRAAKSEYLLWRPVKGNSHIELTMGHDIRQICYDIKNLVEYAASHRQLAPLLPRRV